ncbi:MAG TPA: peptide deformylase [Stellaceae bacterium]|nr:peptide deformylase [Stellaceae bacterium]
MSRLPILIAPDPTLKTKAKPVAAVDDRVRQLMDDMADTMYAAPGIGLAAPQIGVLERIVVLDVSRDSEPPRLLQMANPEITWTSEEVKTVNEGCLSLPEYYADITRPAEVEVRYLDRHGSRQQIRGGGLLATCVQHEIDHLNGVLFVDHLSALKRNIILRKLVKLKKAQAEEDS